MDLTKIAQIESLVFKSMCNRGGSDGTIAREHLHFPSLEMVCRFLFQWHPQYQLYGQSTVVISICTCILYLSTEFTGHHICCWSNLCSIQSSLRYKSKKSTNMLKIGRQSFDFMRMHQHYSLSWIASGCHHTQNTNMHPFIDPP